MKKISYLFVAVVMIFSVIPYSVLAQTSNVEIDMETNNEVQDIETEVKEEIEEKEKEEVKEEVKEVKEDIDTQKTEEKENVEKSDQILKEKKQEEQKQEESKKEKEDNNSNKDAKKEINEKQIDQYNEFGIKKGTMVYGVDISKLSKKELQYIPKNWRDGVSEEEAEHKDESSEKAMFRSARYPDVNNYIKKKNLKSANVKLEHYNKFERFQYRFKKPEGVVAHETANNNSTIRSEINYMKKNRNNAFVHAFVDDNEIIEIHPSYLGVWGAGYVGNQRFIQVELVRVHNFDAFARSINNYAEYIAMMLYQYNLGVSSADATGKGTLWSHKAVSRHLGGTNHVDPHGYFAKYGYNWNEFTKLVKEKYNSKSVQQTANKLYIKESKTSKLGHLRTGATIYKEAGKKKGSFLSGKYTNKVYYIKLQKKIGDELYYLISNSPSSKKNTVGWVKSNEIAVHAHKGVNSTKKTLYVKGTGKAFSKAWGGSKDLVYHLKNEKNKKFYVNKTETVGKNTWYRGKLNGKQVFIHSSYVIGSSENKTSKLGHIKSSNVEVFKNYSDLKGKVAGNDATNKVYYIKKQAKFGNQLYYLIGMSPTSKSDTLGWVKSQDLSVHTHKGVNRTKKTLYVKGTGKAFSKAWGGSKDLVYHLKNEKNKKFYVNKAETVGKNMWYRGKLNGKQVFIHSSYVVSANEKKTSKLGHIRASNVEVFKSYTDLRGEDAGSQATNKVYYIKKQAQLGSQLYYLIGLSPTSTKNTTGWVKAQDLSVHTHKGVNRSKKTLTIKGTGKAFAKAWGGSKDLVYHLKNEKNKKFYVNKAETVGRNTWYRGKLNGKQVFIHSSYLN